VRVIASRHDACAGDTRVRLPGNLPARAVRRVVCDRCAQPYEPAGVDDIGAEPPGGGSKWRIGSIGLPSLPAPALPPLPEVSWRLLSLPVAAVAVVGGLMLIQGDDDPSTPVPAAPVAESGPGGAQAGSTGRDGGGGEVPADAQLISESTFQLALPAGWKEIAPSGGATFAAAASGGDADAMLWVEHDPKLDFATFEARSVEQLRSLAGSAAVSERNLGPTPPTTTSLIEPTSAPPTAPNYEVLISGGFDDYWYYLATTTQPGASPDVTQGVELIQGSFAPLGGKG
jgi:hypothetical protein